MRRLALFLCALALHGQKLPPSATARYLVSEEGRSLLEVSGHPLSRSMNGAFGEPSAAALTAARTRWRAYTASAPPDAQPAATPCTGNSGARFNLEQRAGAAPQQNASADFILNGSGPGNDLVVQTANDFRGTFASATWDNSISGYYVHRAGSPDCSVQFEGGLPAILFHGAPVLGVGDAAVVADPVRGAFFMADVRFGPAAGIGLFRASAANLHNPTNCPAGTHLETQAESCWAQTPPVLLNPVPQPYYSSEFTLAVDERVSGTGAGDLYVAANTYIASAGAFAIAVTACTNATLRCSPLVTLSSSGTAPFVRVRQDGVITISYLGATNGTGISQAVGFVTCTPVGAPNPPVCATASTAVTIQNPLPTPSQFELTTPIKGIDLFVTGTFPKHGNRLESNGAYTTFLVYDDCRTPYTPPPPPSPQPTLCLNTQVKMVVSADGGQSWSAPVAADAASGHHFYPSIAVDRSTGTSNLVYYTTAGDPFHHRVNVVMNQIAPGSTVLGPQMPLTQFPAPMDLAPGRLHLDMNDFHLGAIVRGTGVAGQSHLYTSFSRTMVNGTYNGAPLPDKNNHITLTVY
ncbi:MAG: hypothetical protein ABI693_10835 [Bryobacteraceae bacterium]